jgi:hypothetical protein
VGGASTAYNLSKSGSDEPSDSTISIHAQLVRASEVLFEPSIFRTKLLGFIAVLHLPFSIVECDEFRDMMLYTHPTSEAMILCVRVIRQSRAG